MQTAESNGVDMENLSVNVAQRGSSGLSGKMVGESAVANGASIQSSQPDKQVADVSNFVTSPKGVFDPESGLYLLQYRDQSTGEVTKQYPSEKVVDAYRRGTSEAAGAASSVAASTAASIKATTGGSLEKVGGSIPASGSSTTAAVSIDA